MKLSEWARTEGIHPKTAYRWFGEGKLPVRAEKLPSGTIVVRQSPTASGEVVVYARVSSHDQRSGLDVQVARATEAATAARLVVGRVVTEVGSELNGRRRKLSALLSHLEVDTIVVTHRNRLARFGTVRAPWRSQPGGEGAALRSQQRRPKGCHTRRAGSW